MAVRVSLAGRVGIEVGGTAIRDDGLGRLGWLAFAFLVCERHRPVPRDELAEVVWGEELPRSWEQLLRGIAFKARTLLSAAGLDPTTALVSEHRAYRVHLPLDAVVDVEEAAAAAEMGQAALGAGDPLRARELAGAVVALASRQFLPGGSGVWVERRQAEMRGLHVRGLEVLAAAAEAQGRWAAAAASAEEAVGLEPFRESAYRLLMAAHAGAGNRGDALRVYERCRRVLSEELGVNPSAATESAYLRLLGDPEPAAAPALPATLPPLPPALAETPGAFLVGRATELERLAATLDLARGRRQAVLVGGEPGIGKTVLVAALARRAHGQGARVLYGRCDEDVAVAYQPFAEALGQLAATCPLPDLAAQVAGRGELLQLLPDLGRRLPEVRPPPPSDPESDRFRLFESVCALLAAASSVTPVVLLLDDLHWAADSTLLLLRHLLQSAPTAALLVIGTYRNTDAGADHPLTALLADLRRVSGVERLMLSGLDEQAVGAFVATAGARVLSEEDWATARAIHAHTAGNPFFVGELFRHLTETGAVFRREGRWTYYQDADVAAPAGVPDGVREVVARRLHRLSPSANRVLVLAAVVGLQFELDVLERVADAEGVLDALEEAVEGSLVVELGPGRHRFAHALVRDTIYSGLSFTRRSRLHGAIGDAMATLPGDSAPRLAALAHHFAEAAKARPEDAVKAADYALAAATQAVAQAAWEDAVASLQRGLAALDANDPSDQGRRFELLFRQAEALAAVWDTVRAEQLLLRAADSARALRSPDRLAQAAILAMRVTSRHAELGEEALVALGDTAPALRAQLLALLALGRNLGPTKYEPATLEALALARRSADGTALRVALNARMAVVGDSGDAHERLALADEMVSLAPSAGRDWAPDAYGKRAMARLVLGDRAGFEADAAEDERLGGQRRSAYLRWRTALWRAMRALLDGRFGDVAALASAAAAVPGDDALGKDTFAIQMGKLAMEQGRPEEFKEGLCRFVDGHPEHGVLRSMLAFTCAELGEANEARRHFDLLAADDFGQVKRLVPVTLAYLAEVAAAQHDAERAGIVYARFRPYAGQVVATGAVAHCPGAVDRYLGQLAATVGAFDEAEAHYQAALVLDGGLDAPPLLARTRYWYGRLLLERPDRGDACAARDLLASTVETATLLGMDGLAASAEDRLAADLAGR